MLLVLKTQYNIDKPSFPKKIDDADKKILDTKDLLKKLILTLRSLR